MEECQSSIKRVLSVAFTSDCNRGPLTGPGAVALATPPLGAPELCLFTIVIYMYASDLLDRTYVYYIHVTWLIVPLLFTLTYLFNNIYILPTHHNFFIININLSFIYHAPTSCTCLYLLCLICCHSDDVFKHTSFKKYFWLFAGSPFVLALDVSNKYPNFPISFLFAV